ncbi:MAG: component of the polarisome [Piccolia ochrophora]|nr:MAG: component of the polarisome [Piccolia ochrophora]
MSGRAGTLSPVSAEGSEWSGISKYQNPPRGDHTYSPSISNARSGALATPPISSGSSGIMNGGFPPPTGRRPSDSPGNPSPPNSIARSSDGAGLYSSGDSGQSRKGLMLEETLSEHYGALKRFLANYLHQGPANARPNRARDKLLRLTAVQFQELSTDVFDELVRRQNVASFARGGGPPERKPPAFLLPKDTFHPKRNQARQKLSSLTYERFRDLAMDVYYELERRFPRFLGGDLDRVGSPASSIRSGRGPGPFMRGPGPPGPRKGYPSGSSLGPMGPGNELGRPLPKTFQSNTMVPNKSTLVEYDDDQVSPLEGDDSEGDPYGTRQSNRHTAKSGRDFERNEKLFVEYQTQVGELREKVTDLENRLQSKGEEVSRLQDSEREKTSVCPSFDHGNHTKQQLMSIKTADSERQEWSDLRANLENKITDALNLNESLESELHRIRAETANNERELRNQLDNAKKTASNSGGEWKDRYLALEREHKELKIDLREQQQITEDVRNEALSSLREMKSLTDHSDQANEREEHLSKEAERLEAEVQEWKGRYARTKTQLRNVRASSMGLSMQLQDARETTNGAFTSLEGLVKDVHVTKFQIAIDELLRIARGKDPCSVVDQMKAVVMSVRHITQDIGDAPSDESEELVQRTKLKTRVSATANNLITASKNYASSHGISPVSLLDAAASHLTASVVELVRAVKIRPTPAGDLDEDEDGVTPLGGAPGYFPIRPGTSRVSAESSYSVDSPIRQSVQSPNASKDRWAQGTRSSNFARSNGQGHGRSSSNYGSRHQESELEDLKNYLEDQTEGLVHSIQSLVASIRADDGVPLIRNHLEEIASVVAKVVSSTEAAIDQTSNVALHDALRQHIEPILRKLAECRARLLAASAEAERIKDSKMLKNFSIKLPPLAFEIARETKELVQRIDQVDHDVNAEDDNFR